MDKNSLYGRALGQVTSAARAGGGARRAPRQCRARRQPGRTQHRATPRPPAAAHLAPACRLHPSRPPRSSVSPHTVSTYLHYIYLTSIYSRTCSNLLSNCTDAPSNADFTSADLHSLRINIPTYSFIVYSYSYVRYNSVLAIGP